MPGRSATSTHALDDLLPPHRLLLRAALLDGDAALDAWRQWEAGFDIDATDPAGFVLMPRLYLNLARLGADHPLMPKLRGLYRYAWTRNQKVRQGLIAALQALSAASIPALVHKHLPLLLRHDGDLGARPLFQIDVAIRESDLIAAHRRLMDSGWRPRKPCIRQAIAPYVELLIYDHPQWSRLNVWLHPFRIACPRRIEALAWERAGPIEAEGIDARCFADAELLWLTLMTDPLVEPNSAAQKIADSVALLRSPAARVDWPAFIELSKGAGAAGAVGRLLAEIEQEFGVPIPADVSRQLLESRDRASIADAAPLGRAWRRYAEAQAARGSRAGPLGFTRFAVDYYRYFWDVRHVWQLPMRAAQRVIRRPTHSNGSN